jgi:hypothetical protein
VVKQFFLSKEKGWIYHPIPSSLSHSADWEGLRILDFHGPFSEDSPFFPWAWPAMINRTECFFTIDTR